MPDCLVVLTDRHQLQTADWDTPFDALGGAIAVWTVRNVDRTAALGAVLARESGLPGRAGVEIDQVVGPLRRQKRSV